MKNAQRQAQIHMRRETFEREIQTKRRNFQREIQKTKENKPRRSPLSNCHTQPGCPAEYRLPLGTGLTHCWTNGMDKPSTTQTRGYAYKQTENTHHTRNHRGWFISRIRQLYAQKQKSESETRSQKAACIEYIPVCWIESKLRTKKKRYIQQDTRCSNHGGHFPICSFFHVFLLLPFLAVLGMRHLSDSEFFSGYQILPGYHVLPRSEVLVTV